MRIKVYYIGPDEKYWHRLQARFLEDYDEHTFDFLSTPPQEGFSVISSFKELYNSKPEIIYLDFSQYSEKMNLLAKWLCRNNEMRLSSLVGLYDNAHGFEAIIQGVNSTIRLNHIKCNEIQDVVYDPISLLDVNMAHMPSRVQSAKLEDFELWQPMRVSYVQNNRFHVETNSYLKLDQIVEVDSHPLQHLMPSKQVYVDKFYDRDLYYNRRFAYDLEFIYNDDDYFSATNKDWKLYKVIKDNPESEELTSLSKLKRLEILDEMEKRKKFSEEIVRKIDSWMKQHIGQIEPKKLKIMAIDDTLEILNGLEQALSPFPYSLNTQTILLNDCYQIQRTMPHLIVLRITKINNVEMIKSIVKKISEIAEYEPYLFLFCPKETSKYWQDLLGYPHVMSTPEEISLERTIELAKTLDAKLNISEQETKVFFKASDPNSNLFLKRSAKVLGMTESVLYFESSVEIPMWTVFLVKKPVRMLLTVVPHEEEGEFSKQINCYRCLINGVGEPEKANIRRLINASFDVD